MGIFLTSEFQNPPSLSSLSPAPPHHDPQAYEKSNMAHSNSKDLKQDTHPNAEIEGNPSKDIKRCALQKIIYTKLLSLVPAELVQTYILFHSLVREINQMFN